MTPLRERALEAASAGQVDQHHRLRLADLQVANVRWYAAAAIAAGATPADVATAAAAGCELGRDREPDRLAGVKLAAVPA